jgi:hypothetical protein
VQLEFVSKKVHIMLQAEMTNKSLSMGAAFPNSKLTFGKFGCLRDRDGNGNWLIFSKVKG